MAATESALNPRPIVLCLLLFVGCGGGNDPYAPVDDALCAWTVKCAGGTSDDEAACRAASAERRARAAYSLGEAVASGRATLDSAGRDACVASIRGADCAELPMGQCRSIVRGNVRPGGACWGDAECVGGTCERGSPYPTPGCGGVCVAYPKRGDACTDRCSPDDYCDTTTHVCTALKPAGATCTNLGECEGELQCNGPEGARVCSGPGQSGDPCPVVVTVERRCALGLYCASEGTSLSGTCAPRVGEAQPCTTSLQCQDGLVCVAAADGTASCARPLAEGAACVPTPAVGIPGCQLQLACDPTSHCRRPPEPQGRACAGDLDCQATFEDGFYYCDGASKTCARRAALGEACVPQTVPAASCSDGICDAAGRRCILVCN